MCTEHLSRHAFEWHGANCWITKRAKWIVDCMSFTTSYSSCESFASLGRQSHALIWAKHFGAVSDNRGVVVGDALHSHIIGAMSLRPCLIQCKPIIRFADKQILLPRQVATPSPIALFNANAVPSEPPEIPPSLIAPFDHGCCTFWWVKKTSCLCMVMLHK
jgi:hypothetical protein